MVQPLTRVETESAGLLTDAALRLEHAVQTLEAVLGRGPVAVAAASTTSAQVVELEVVRWRGQALEAAAADASQALGRAMAEVQRALQADAAEAPDPQPSLFDAGLRDVGPPEDGRLDLPLESAPGLPDEEEEGAGQPSPAKEPTA